MPEPVGSARWRSSRPVHRFSRAASPSSRLCSTRMPLRISLGGARSPMQTVRLTHSNQTSYRLTSTTRLFTPTSWSAEATYESRVLGATVLVTLSSKETSGSYWNRGNRDEAVAAFDRRGLVQETLWPQSVDGTLYSTDEPGATDGPHNTGVPR